MTHLCKESDTIYHGQPVRRYVVIVANTVDAVAYSVLPDVGLVSTTSPKFGSTYYIWHRAVIVRM